MKLVVLFALVAMCNGQTYGGGGLIQPTPLPTPSPTSAPTSAPTAAPTTTAAPVATTAAPVATTVAPGPVMSSCADLSAAGTTNLVEAARNQWIGEGDKICRITGGCSTCACSAYAKYSTDGGATWLGMTYQGTPGGTGCASGSMDAYFTEHYLNAGICGDTCTAPVTTVAPVATTVAPGPVMSSCADLSADGTTNWAEIAETQWIGEGDKICRISTSPNACAKYAKYSTDGGATWLGMTFEGVPGGSGCPTGCLGSSCASGAMESYFTEKYINAGICGDSCSALVATTTAPTTTTVAPIATTVAPSDPVCSDVATPLLEAGASAECIMGACWGYNDGPAVSAEVLKEILLRQCGQGIGFSDSSYAEGPSCGSRMEEMLVDMGLILENAADCWGRLVQSVCEDSEGEGFTRKQLKGELRNLECADTAKCKALVSRMLDDRDCTPDKDLCERDSTGEYDFDSIRGEIATLARKCDLDKFKKEEDSTEAQLDTRGYNLGFRLRLSGVGYYSIPTNQYGKVQDDVKQQFVSKFTQKFSGLSSNVRRDQVITQLTWAKKKIDHTRRLLEDEEGNFVVEMDLIGLDATTLSLAETALQEPEGELKEMVLVGMKDAEPDIFKVADITVVQGSVTTEPSPTCTLPSETAGYSISGCMTGLRSLSERECELRCTNTQDDDAYAVCRDGEQVFTLHGCDAAGEQTLSGAGCAQPTLVVFFGALALAALF